MSRWKETVSSTRAKLFNSAREFNIEEQLYIAGLYPKSATNAIRMYVIIGFLSFVTLSWILVTFKHEGQWIYWTANYVAYMGNNTEYFYLPFVSWTFEGMWMGVYFINHRHEPRTYRWCYIYDMFRKPITPKEMMENKKFIRHVLWADTMQKSFVYGCNILTPFTLLLPLLIYWDLINVIIYGIPWVIIRQIWMLLLTRELFRTKSTIYQTGYYYELELNKLNEKAKQTIDNSAKANIIGNISQVPEITKLIKDVNRLVNAVHQTNHVMRNAILPIYASCCFVVPFGIYQIFIADTETAIRWAFGSYVFATLVLGLIFPAMTAGIVTEGRKLYRTMSRLAVLPLPLKGRIKLMLCLENLGDEKLGYTVGSIFRITQESSLKMFLEIGSMFLLLVQSTQNQPSPTATKA